MSARTVLSLSICTGLFLIGAAASPPPVRRVSPLLKIEAHGVEVERSSGMARVDLPYFDALGRLRWDDSPAPGAVCPAPSREIGRITWLQAPRIDAVRCRSLDTGDDPFTVVASYDGTGRSLWQRRLGYRTGTLTLDEQVIGASPDGIVLSDLAVLSARTGELLRPAPAHPVPGEDRSEPDGFFPPATILLPDRHSLLTFPDYEPGPTGWEGSARRVERLAHAPGSPYLLMARQSGGCAILSVLDLRTGREVATRRFRPRHVTRDPRLALGRDGNVGFAFFDATEGREILVTYRLPAE